jgi:outer membrane protein insertion porin family
VIPDIKPGVFIDDYKMEDAQRKLKDHYVEKGFTRVEISHELTASADGSVKLIFKITENKVVHVKAIHIEGNNTFTYKRIIKVIKTHPAWIFNRTVYKEDAIDDDKKRLVDFYRLQGFNAVEVDVKHELRFDGVHIFVKIKEGFRSYVGTVTIAGNRDVLTDQLEKVMELKDGKVYSDYAVYEEVSRLRDVYMDHGYIFVRIDNDPSFNAKTQKVDINYVITENDVAYVNEILVRGNIKTKDKVIRRELRIYPGDRYDGKKVKRSKERLENLDYFKDVRFDTEPKATKDQVDLVVNVNENKTGYFSFGGGYSTVDSVMGFIELRQRNLDFANWNTFTGGGQDATINASVGAKSNQYGLSFNNPYIFDWPYSFGFEVHRRGHKRDDSNGYYYQDEDFGGSVNVGHEFNEYFSSVVSYGIDQTKISNVEDSASSSIKSVIGKTTLFNMGLGTYFSTRDNVINPNRGILISNMVNVYGGPFGGDYSFVKDYFGVNEYIPFAHKSVLELRFNAGISSPYNRSADTPLFERFYAGGQGTIRGYHERLVGPQDLSDGDPIGGDSIILAGVEYTYPIVDFVKGAIFFDAGDVWPRVGDIFSTKLLKSVGMGLRVKTPIGPISIDYGFPLDAEPGEDHVGHGRFNFNVSRGF